MAFCPLLVSAAGHVQRRERRVWRERRGCRRRIWGKALFGLAEEVLQAGDAGGQVLVAEGVGEAQVP